MYITINKVYREIFNINGANLDYDKLLHIIRLPEHSEVLIKKDIQDIINESPTVLDLDMALLEAAFYGKRSEILALMLNGADPATIDEYGNSSLVKILISRDSWNDAKPNLLLGFVGILLEHGADPAQQNEDLESFLTILNKVKKDRAKRNLAISLESMYNQHLKKVGEKIKETNIFPRGLDVLIRQSLASTTAELEAMEKAKKEG